MIAIFDKFPGIYCLRFGSIISGAIQSKLSARNEKSGEMKPSSKKPKHQRGSFSFFGGMQVFLLFFPEKELQLMHSIVP